MVAHLERIREDRLLRWSAYASVPYAWLAIALLNPMLLVVPPMLAFALWKAMQFGMVSRTDPQPEPDDF
jgi:hypothetical protein